MTQEDINARIERGRQLFLEGYNCSQAVVLALCDIYDLDTTLAARLSGSYGGGIGRMREVCGSACGMFMMAGMEVTKHGEQYPDENLKRRNYEAVQQLAATFKEGTGGHLICRDILAARAAQLAAEKAAKNAESTCEATPATDTLSLDGTNPTPAPRTEDYYRTRPCIRMVENAIRTYCEWLDK